MSKLSIKPATTYKKAPSEATRKRLRELTRTRRASDTREPAPTRAGTPGTTLPEGREEPRATVASGILRGVGTLVIATTAAAFGTFISRYWWDRYQRGALHLPGLPPWQPAILPAVPTLAVGPPPAPPPPLVR